MPGVLLQSKRRKNSKIMHKSAPTIFCRQTSILVFEIVYRLLLVISKNRKNPMKFVWRSLALVSVLIGSARLSKVAATVSATDFPIWIELDKPQLVTVVIEDAAGHRVRNLVAEMQLPAGRNRLSWDGFDDGRRNAHGDLIRKRVAPGTYCARGLSHDGIKTIYEFTAYSGGNPAWPNKERTGGWLADHSAPMSALFLPPGAGSPYGGGKSQVLLSALIAEAGAPFVWVGTDGETYQRNSVFGWDGAIALARDIGTRGRDDVYAYGIMAGETSIKLRGFKRDGSGMEILTYQSAIAMPREPGTIGLSLAVRDGLAVISVPGEEKLLFVDTIGKKVLGLTPMPSPRGLLFDHQGRLLVVSAGKIQRFTLSRKDPAAAPVLGDATIFVAQGLEDPRTLAISASGEELYVADWGQSHQVKVFSPTGKLRRTIGKPGGAQLGLYDELRMTRPQGLALDDKGQLWVAEADHLPKRISVWTAGTGKLVEARYGPPHYGGGGTIDPLDKTRFFYATFEGVMEFKLDWANGTSRLHAVVCRQDIQRFARMPGENWLPETPLRVGGRTYLIGGYQGGLRGNTYTATFLLDETTHIARPVSYVGSDRWWPNIAKDKAIVALAPDKKNEQFLAWSDLNNDGQPQPEEFTYRVFDETFVGRNGETRKTFGYRDFNVNSDLSLQGSWGITVPTPLIRPDGVPIYDLAKARFAITPTQELVAGEDGYDTRPLKDGSSLVGLLSAWRKNKLLWSYPERRGEPPQFPGDIVDPTRLLGPVVTAALGDAGQWYAVNAEKGNIFLFTADGLFIQELGGDMRVKPLIRFPEARRGLVMENISFEDEHFHPTVTQTQAGEIYLVAGKEHSSIFRLAGFENIRRRAFGTVQLTPAAMAPLPETRVTKARQQGRATTYVNLLTAPPKVDGKLDDWSAGTRWQEIGNAGLAAVTVSGDRLYAAFKTSDPHLLDNDAVNPTFMFKNGGSIDLMIGTDATADPRRTSPVKGDLRLLVTKVKGRPVAMLYRAVVPGTQEKNRVLFESPIGKVWFDRVDDLSGQLHLAQNGGNVEFSVPLSALSFSPQAGESVLADFGILRGNGAQTIQRLYWNNFNTSIVSDIPGEARLQPANWGLWTFRAFNTNLRDPDPAAVKATISGLRYDLFKPTGNFEGRIPDFSKMQLTSSGTTDTFVFPTRAEKQPGLRFSGYITVPEDGLYTFYLQSDAESRLYIGDQMVVQANRNETITYDGDILLKAGKHAIRVEYVNDFARAQLQVSWQGSGFGKTEIVQDSLRREP